MRRSKKGGGRTRDIQAIQNTINVDDGPINKNGEIDDTLRVTLDNEQKNILIVGIISIIDQIKSELLNKKKVDEYKDKLNKFIHELNLQNENFTDRKEINFPRSDEIIKIMNQLNSMQIITLKHFYNMIKVLSNVFTINIFEHDYSTMIEIPEGAMSNTYIESNITNLKIFKTYIKDNFQRRITNLHKDEIRTFMKYIYDKTITLITNSIRVSNLLLSKADSKKVDNSISDRAVHTDPDESSSASASTSTQPPSASTMITAKDIKSNVVLPSIAGETSATDKLIKFLEDEQNTNKLKDKHKEIVLERYANYRIVPEMSELSDRRIIEDIITTLNYIDTYICNILDCYQSKIMKIRENPGKKSNFSQRRGLPPTQTSEEVKFRNKVTEMNKLKEFFSKYKEKLNEHLNTLPQPPKQEQSSHTRENPRKQRHRGNPNQRGSSGGKRAMKKTRVGKAKAPIKKTRKGKAKRAMKKTRKGKRKSMKNKKHTKKMR